ncbi:hypothetical protein [Evansella tamaricis]|uniref:Uncharacterized protein n=1 Tax=Evansella tamaricis TaxID=2069301 RepID=A0ABS6JIE8_9BACI|nr:hypothetical protein [Evansella tamaricis]MBU9712974.1 hypothetical protein [Evansella tamaricis]
MKMKKIFLLLAIVLASFMVGCSEESTGKENSTDVREGIFLKDTEGNTLASISDLLPGSAKVTFEEGIRLRAIEVQFQEPEKLEAITTDYRHQTIYFYDGEELIASPVIADVISNGIVVIDGGFSEEHAFGLVDEINNQ